MTCRKCGGDMKPSTAIQETLVGEPDDLGSDVITMSPGGSGKLIDCMKCEKCGWSVTMIKDTTEGQTQHDAAAEAEALFRTWTSQRKTKTGFCVKCRKGLWRVDAPTKRKAIQEAEHYFAQYFVDGEYAGVPK